MARCRKAKPVETMLRMYLLQVWFSLADEGVEEAIYDSYAMRRFMGLDFAVEQVPDTTMLLHFCHLLEEHQLGERPLAGQNEMFDEQGWIMGAGSIVDATIIAAPSTNNLTGTRDPEMHQTQKGNQWYFGMKAHIGIDAGTGHAHTVTATSANVHGLDEVVNLVRDDDEIVDADARVAQEPARNRTPTRRAVGHLGSRPAASHVLVVRRADGRVPACHPALFPTRGRAPLPG